MENTNLTDLESDIKSFEEQFILKLETAKRIITNNPDLYNELKEKLEKKLINHFKLVFNEKDSEEIYAIMFDQDEKTNVYFKFVGCTFY